MQAGFDDIFPVISPFFSVLDTVFPWVHESAEFHDIRCRDHTPEVKFRSQLFAYRHLIHMEMSSEERRNWFYSIPVIRVLCKFLRWTVYLFFCWYSNSFGACTDHDRDNFHTVSLSKLLRTGRSSHYNCILRTKTTGTLCDMFSVIAESKLCVKIRDTAAREIRIQDRDILFFRNILHLPAVKKPVCNKYGTSLWGLHPFKCLFSKSLVACIIAVILVICNDTGLPSEVDSSATFPAPPVLLPVFFTEGCIQVCRIL